MIILHVFAMALLPHGVFLLRRSRRRPTRRDAFAELFDALGSLYECASRLKPEWEDAWHNRHATTLPPKYAVDNDLAVSAARDMRHAIFLLQRHRWKSVVQPLFDHYDIDAWNAFVESSSCIPMQLVSIGDDYIDLLYEDERDWIVNAVEQFDDAIRHRAAAIRTDTPMHRVVAEGTYLPVHIAIQLSDRLIERLRYEEGKGG